MRTSPTRMVAGIAAVTCGVLLTTGVAAAVLTQDDGSVVPDAAMVRLYAPGLDDSIDSVEMATNNAASDADLESLLPFVTASSVSGTVDGSPDRAYTLDVLDPRSQIDEIVAIDSLKPLSEGIYWGVFEDPRQSVTEVVGEIGGVKIAVVVSGVLSAEEAEAFVGTISVGGSK